MCSATYFAKFGIFSDKKYSSNLIITWSVPPNCIRLESLERRVPYAFQVSIKSYSSINYF